MHVGRTCIGLGMHEAGHAGIELHIDRVCLDRVHAACAQSNKSGTQSHEPFLSSMLTR